MRFSEIKKYSSLPVFDNRLKKQDERAKNSKMMSDVDQRTRSDFKLEEAKVRVCRTYTPNTVLHLDNKCSLINLFRVKTGCGST